MPRHAFFYSFHMKKNEELYEVIIIGGGACGLMAAAELSSNGKKTALLEAMDRLGGRIYTYTNDSFSSMVELGAEFIHGDLPITSQILKEENIQVSKAEGKMVSFYENIFHNEDLFEKENGDTIKNIYKSLDEDISVSSFIRKYLQGKEQEELRYDIIQYVEGYHAADLEKASSFGLLKDFFSGEDVNYRIDGGYGSVIDHLHKKIINGNCNIFLSQPVMEIIREKDRLIVKTNSSEFLTKKVLITISLGCLQKETIKFSPALPEITTAAKKLGYGAVIKLVLEFHSPFWLQARHQDLSKMLFVFSGEKIPTWWTQYPRKENTLTGWFAGPDAYKENKTADQEMMDMGIQSLSSIFDQPVSELNDNLKTARVANWVSNPYINGGYAYEVVGGDQWKSVIMKPIENRIFFAGEALQEGSETGTVEAALNSGKKVAELIVEMLK